MKIAITGSHFTPAQAVIAELKKFDPDLEIIYIGRKYTREGDKSPSAESEVIPKLGVKFIPLITGRLQRKFTGYTVSSLFKIPIGLVQAMGILIREKPDAVVSFGGYVGVPVVFGAWLLSIPVLVHEQALLSGLANQISGIFADKVAVSFDRDYKFNQTKVVLTGNPIRREILHPAASTSAEIKQAVALAKSRKLPLILITGGNQGSHAINQAVLDGLEEITALGVIIHQTGESKFDDYGQLQAKRSNLPRPEFYIVEKWIEGQDIGMIFKNADLVVSRAGINTLLEIAYWGIPALVIPLPFARKDEQNINASYFQKLGVAQVLPQSGLNAKTLSERIARVLDKTGNFSRQRNPVKPAVLPDAAKRVVQEVLLLIHRHTNSLPSGDTI